MSLVSEGADLAVTEVAHPHVEPSLASVGDYLALMKPRVMSLVVFTALVGLVVAPAHIHPVIGFTALLCIAVGAGSARLHDILLYRHLDDMAQACDAAKHRHRRRGGRLAAGDRLGGGDRHCRDRTD